MGNGPFYRGGRNDSGLPVDDPGLAFIAALVGAVNIILLFLLLLVYFSNYRKLKSSFSLGLVLFTILLILQNAIFMFFLLLAEGFRGPGMGVPVLSINLIQLSALLVLLKITNF